MDFTPFIGQMIVTIVQSRFTKDVDLSNFVLSHRRIMPNDSVNDNLKIDFPVVKPASDFNRLTGRQRTNHRMRRNIVILQSGILNTGKIEFHIVDLLNVIPSNKDSMTLF